MNKLQAFYRQHQCALLRQAKVSSIFILTLLTSALGQAVQWQTVLSCNQSQAILQVNVNERRNFQFVVKDANIITYFNGARVFRNHGNNFGNSREFIVSGHAQNGIFNSGDFQSAAGNYNYADNFQLSREGIGLKIVLKKHKLLECLRGRYQPINRNVQWRNTQRC